MRNTNMKKGILVLLAAAALVIPRFSHAEVPVFVNAVDQNNLVPINIAGIQLFLHPVAVKQINLILPAPNLAAQQANHQTAVQAAIQTLDGVHSVCYTLAVQTGNMNYIVMMHALPFGRVAWRTVSPANLLAIGIWTFLGWKIRSSADLYDYHCFGWVNGVFRQFINPQRTLVAFEALNSDLAIAGGAAPAPGGAGVPL